MRRPGRFVSLIIALVVAGNLAIVAAALFGWTPVVVTVFAVGAVTWMLREAWRTSFPPPTEKLSDASVQQLTRIARKRQQETGL